MIVNLSGDFQAFVICSRYTIVMICCLDFDGCVIKLEDNDHSHELLHIPLNGK